MYNDGGSPESLPYLLDSEQNRGWNRSSTKNTKNETEWGDHSLTKNGTEQDGMERERNNWKKRNKKGTI